MQNPPSCPRSLLFVLALAGVTAVTTAARADGPYVSPDDHAPAGDPRVAHYPSPYQKPKPDEIVAIMQRVRTHADSLNQIRLVDAKTKQEITDLSTPNPDASVNLGGYPLGVLHAGMLLAGEVTGDKSFTDFTARRFQFISDHLPYFQALAAKYGMKGNSLHNFLEPSSLDACGAWGAALVKARRAGVGPDLKPVIDRYAEYISHGQFRLADGTLARHSPQAESVWGDDMYMSVPFLAQMGKLTGDDRYYDDAVRQVLQMSARLFDEQKGIFAHGWSANTADNNPEFFWGRANGWCMMAMVELLSVLPENHPGRDQILKILRTQIKGVAALQSGDGLWHQLLDRPDSFLETSCSAMFTFSIARAINRGWVSGAAFGAVALAGWNGVSTRVTPEGTVEGVCIGTNYATDAVYYYNRPARDDEHGYGPVLLAGSEMIRLVQNEHLDIRYRGGTYIFTDKN